MTSYFAPDGPLVTTYDHCQKYILTSASLEWMNHNKLASGRPSSVLNFCPVRGPVSHSDSRVFSGERLRFTLA